VRALGPRQIHVTLGFVDAVERARLPFAVGDLTDRRAVGLVVIQVLPAAPLREPQEAAVLQPARRPEVVHPRLGRLAEQRLDVAARRVAEVEIEPALLAVLDLEHDLLRIRRPRHVHDQELDGRVLFEVEELRRPPGHAHRRDLHGRVRIAGLRVMPALDGRPIRDVVDQRVLGDVLLVELKERERARIGAPPVRLVVAAAVDLFLIDPVELAVQQLVGPVGRQPTFALVRERHDVEVVGAREGDQRAVRAEARVVLGARSERQPGRLVRGNVVRIEIVGDRDQQRGPLVVPDEAPARRAAGVLGREPEPRQRGVHPGGLEQRLALAAGGVDLQPLARAAPASARAGLAFRVDEVRVADPGDPGRRAAAPVGALRGIVEIVERQELLLGIRWKADGEQRGKREGARAQSHGRLLRRPGRHRGFYARGGRVDAGPTGQ
jgi:hypothetical protein